MNLKISPYFFLTAAIIGYLNAGSLIGTLFWVAVIFISVLFHECGHASLSYLFGQHPRIELVAFGGLTYPEGKKIPLWQEFIVVLAGPVFGFLLFVAAYFLLKLPIQNLYLLYFLQALKWINLFWTMVNLIPVLPLDGGQLVRIVLEKFFRVKAWRYSYAVSMVIATLIAIFFFVMGGYFIGAIFFLFAFQSFEGFRSAQNMTETDSSSPHREELKGIEGLLLNSRVEEAKIQLEHLREKTNKGLLHTLATEYLAKIDFDQGHLQEAYDLLKIEKEKITDQAKYILHVSAFAIGDYPLALELSAPCFRSLQLVDIAVRAAGASAAIQDVGTSIEWLKTAKAYGALDLREILKDGIFDPIRSNETFKEFLRIHTC
jgi:Zn-dependent protease